MPDDIEHLKVNKIAPAPKARVGLPIAGQPATGGNVDPSADEAFAEGCESPPSDLSLEDIEGHVVAAIRTVYDPEIPLNVYDLGLIYGIHVDASGEVEIEMTLTAPACPVAGMLVQEVANNAAKAEGVTRAHVKLVWDPPWTKDRMSEDALLELGLL